MTKPTLREAVVDGLGAGIVMSAWMAVVDIGLGRGLWRTPRVIGSIALGSRATRPGKGFAAGPVAAGMSLHEIASALLGVSQWVLTRSAAGRRHPVLAALGAALTAWAVWEYAVMPWAAPTMDRKTAPAELAMANSVFAVALGLLTRRRELPRAAAPLARSEASRIGPPS